MTILSQFSRRTSFFTWLFGFTLIVVSPSVVPAVTTVPVSATKTISVEDHSEALCQWYQAGLRDIPLVHIDDHDDFYSSLVRINTESEVLRSALDSQSCTELLQRTGHQVVNEALYGIADFIYPAWQLGVVSEVWWVVAEKEPLEAAWLKRFKMNKRTRYPAEFLESLEFKNNHIEGVFEGMPVRMLSLQQLPVFDQPILLDIDVDYFLGLYESPLEKQMITLVGDFFRQLFKYRRDTEMVTISVSSNGGYTPVRFRYLGAWMSGAFNDLGSLAKNGPPKAWRLQSGIEEADYLLDRNQAAKLNDELEKIDPKAGLPAYNRAWIAAQQGDLVKTIQAQNEAVSRDRRYVLGYQELATKFKQLGHFSSAEKLLRRGLEIDSQRASFYTELGSLLIDSGKLAEAVDVFDRGIKLLPKVAILHAGRAFALIYQNKRSEALAAIKMFKKMAQPGRNTEAVMDVWQKLLNR